MPTRADICDTEDFFEMSLDCLCVAGLDGYFKRVNPSWTRTLGWTEAELMAVPSVDFVHPDDRERTLAGRQKLGAGEEMGALVNRYRCKDGTYRWLEWRSFGHPERGLVYAAARDVTEQKLADERLRQAQEREAQLERQLTFADRMASVGTLASGVAHEINNPLASVTANIALIIESLDVAPVNVAELRAMALDVKEGAQRIGTIVRGVMTFSRLEDERRALMDLRPVLELASNMTSNEIRHRARLVKIIHDTPSVVADEARLGQVFINLLLNAAQAIPEGHASSNEITLTASTDHEGRAVVEVRDTGAGISAQVIGRIFDPFFTTKPVGVGTGLGLSISHGIVVGLGGTISVTSEPGRGTTFRVVLPPAPSVTAPVAIEAAAAAIHATDAPARAVILVVDDEPAVGKAIRRVLMDHDVTVVTRATEGLELIAADQSFDLIITDLMMPEMSGMDFYDELARRFPDAAARVVFVTGGAFTPDARSFLDRVKNPVIEKPFGLKQLREHVERHFRR